MRKYDPADLARRARDHPPSADETALALKIAYATAARWPCGTSAEGIDHDDLIAEAFYGAWRSLLTYDRGRGVALKTWVITGCRSAIMEALRRADPLTKGERDAYRARLAEYEREVAHDPHIPEPAFPRRMVSLQTALIEQDDDQPKDPRDGYSRSFAARDEGIESAPSRIDAQRIAQRALSILTPGQRHLIEACVMGETSLGEYARQIGAGPSLPSMKKAYALKRMRKVLGAMR